MLQMKRSSGVLAATLAALVIAATAPKAAAQTHPVESSAVHSDELAEIKIARALSAAPPDVAKAATVAEMDAPGKMTVLRAGTNGFTCMPGDPSGVGQPAMCADQASMQWFKDFAEHKPKPTNTVPGITYMLAGATQRSESRSKRHYQPADCDRSALDDHVAVRPQNHRTADHTQADGSLHHLGPERRTRTSTSWDVRSRSDADSEMIRIAAGSPEILWYFSRVIPQLKIIEASEVLDAIIRLR